MIAFRISSDLDKMQAGLVAQQARVLRAIAQGLNEGGDKTRTQVRAAMRQQTGLVQLKSVTRRERGIRAYDVDRVRGGGEGPTRPGSSLSYTIIYTGKPTKPDEFRTEVSKGPGGGVVVWMWNVYHKFKRSFQGSGKLAGKLRMRTTGPRLPLRAFDGPNLAKEAVKGDVAHTFLTDAQTLVMPMIEKRLLRSL